MNANLPLVERSYCCLGNGAFAQEVRRFFELTYTENYNLENPMPLDMPKRDDRLVLAIQSGKIRARITQEENSRRSSPLVFTTLIHDSSIIGSNSFFKQGCIVMPRCVVGGNFSGGQSVVLDIMSYVGHDVTIDDFSTLAPGALVNGYCKIGKRCYIGSGAMIREKTKICDDVTVGMGCVVVKDICEPGTYIGVPARKLDRE